MELATLQLKLQGSPANTVFKKNVTPAQLAIYAHMHGEDCVETLVVTSVDKERTIFEEKQRLQAEFCTEEGVKVYQHLFHGMAPQFPVTFRSIGFDPEMLSDVQTSALHRPPTPSNNAETEIVKKLKAQEASRQTAIDLGQDPNAVSEYEIAGALDNAGIVDDGSALDIENDNPLEAEMRLLQEQSLLPTPPLVTE